MQMLLRKEKENVFGLPEKRMVPIAFAVSVSKRYHADLLIVVTWCNCGGKKHIKELNSVDGYFLTTASNVKNQESL